jgi:sulfotransferase 6B1
MRVVANSVPKSGTNLLSRLLVLLGLEKKSRLGIEPRLVAGPFSPARRFFRAREPEKVTVGVDSPQQIGRRWLARRLSRIPDGCFVNAHCIYTPELAELFREEGMRVVCILRDPRDVAVSQMHYLKRMRKHFAHEAFMALPSDHERLLVCIRGGELGGRKLQSLDQRYRQFLGWEQDEGAVMVKFEDLVGPRGGGSAEAQRRAVEWVAAHVGISVNERTMRLVEENLFGVGRTFRKGQIGGWQEEFSEEHERAVKEVAGPLLVELGYEAGPNWYPSTPDLTRRRS